ncbi:hypothetical protein Tco_0840409 [Tanacetum coccineum]|uniref:Uncharacterized protein n=1 Tax=Tanacetum coccineum TaxID=301880 RepID=A0ABQ5AW51_9ASTR
MFRDTLHLLVETPENPFVAPANIHTIEAFMNRVGYQGVVDKLIIADLMKKFPNIPKRLEEDYHSIKDDVPLIRETGRNRNTPRAPRTPTVFASPQETKKKKQTAGESSSRRITIKRKKQSTPSIPPPRDDQERDAIAEATLLSLTLYKTALLAEAQENIAKVQEKLDEEEIDKLVDGDNNDESSASAFADSVLNDDGDDTRSKLEPGSHKEHPEHMSDDDKQKNDEAIKKEKEVVEIVKETNVDDTSAKKHNEVVMEKEVVNMSGSQEIRKEQKQTPTPSPIRSLRNDLSSDKTISEELADTVTPTTATSSKTPLTTRQKKSFTAKIRRLPGITNTNEMLKKEMPRLVELAVNKDREVSHVDISSMVSKEFAVHGPKLIEELFEKHMQNTSLNLYPKTKSSTATTSSADLQQQLYLSMKTKPQDQAADLEIWELLKAKRMVVDPTNPAVPILEPLSKMTEVDACKDAKEMWERIKRLMHGSKINTHVRYSHLMDEFDKFAAKEGESLDSVHERLTTLVNIMDRNNVLPIPVAINTKFLNCLQLEWIKYVTMVRHNQTEATVSYDVLYDSLVQFEPHYVTDPPSVVDYDDEYQGELQGDSQEDKLTTAMMNQAVVQDGRVNIQTKNAGYGGNDNKNAWRNRSQGLNTGNASDESHYARECQKLKVRNSMYFKEQMLLAMKDEAGSNLGNEENDFMLDTSYGEDLEELTAAVYASSKVHEQVSHGKRKTIIQTTDDDQIDSNIIFDDPFVENNDGTSDHDSTVHDEYHEIQMLAYNVQCEAENQKRLNNELKKQKDLL